MAAPPLEWSLPPETKTIRYNRDAFGYGGTYLYVFRDVEGSLLYVGITGNPVERWRRHAQRKPWWHEVARIEFDLVPKESVALERERDLIRSAAPKYNVRSAVPRG